MSRKENDHMLPVHSLDAHSLHVNILPLDHTNPYDFKREHRHSYFEIMFIENGGGNQLIDFVNYPVKENSCYIICPQQVHLMNRKNSSGTLLQFTEERISSPELSAVLKQHSYTEGASIIFEQQAESISEFQSLINLLKNHALENSKSSALFMTHLLQSIIALMLLKRSSAPALAIEEDKKVLLDFYQILDLRFSENLGVKDYASLLFISEKKLASITKKYAGLTPLQVIHDRIILEAKRMLLFEDSSHKEIAFHLGFDSPATFSAFIKNKTGHSPSELSKQLAEIHK
jgi:AraC-like DNA-binding protein